MLAPCKDCEKRHYNCHSECEDYKVFDEKRKFIRAERIKESEVIDGYLAIRNTVKRR